MPIRNYYNFFFRQVQSVVLYPLALFNCEVIFADYVYIACFIFFQFLSSACRDDSLTREFSYIYSRFYPENMK